MLSIEHTGTFFVLRLLKQHQDTSELVLARHLPAPACERRRILHAHIDDDYSPYERVDDLKAVPQGNPTVVPVRDPVKTLLTMAKRGWEGPHIVRRMQDYKRLAEFEGVYYVPVDTERTEAERYTLLHDCLLFCNLTVQTYAKEMAKHWPKENSSYMSSPEEEAYLRGDPFPLRAKHPCALGALLDARDVLVPFLEARGYKDLSWWTL